MNKSFPRRGDIYWISLDPHDPPRGSEIQKKRPGVILSNDIANKQSNRVIIGPITSSINKIYPFEVGIKTPKGLKKVMLDQIRSIDKIRLGDRIGSVSSEEMSLIESALKLALALF